MALLENQRRIISDVLSWTPTQGRVSIGRAARTYLYQLSADTGSLENYIYIYIYIKRSCHHPRLYSLSAIKAWTAIDKLSIISDLTDKMKRSSFQAAVLSILLYGCTTWTLTKRLEKLDGNYTRMLQAILNKSERQHPTRHQLYGYLPPITKTIQVRRTRYAGHCWRSRDELISDVLQWTPTYGRPKAGRPARTYI